MRPAHAVLLVVLLAAILGATVFREELAAAAPPGIAEVFVTNDVRTPVPVRHVGAADVNVTNGALTVAAAGQPFQAPLQFTFTGAPFAEVFVPVPAGKRLRVELVTLHDLSRAAVAFNRFSMRTTLGGVQATHYLASSTQASGGDVVTQSLQAYADGGTTVSFFLQLSQGLGSNGADFMHGSVSGVLLDLP